MPYKRPRSPFWQIRRRRLPGYGDTGVLSTQTKSRRTAERMERLIEDVADRALVEPRWRALLDAVTTRQITLPELLRAKSERRLPTLLRSLHDPLLSEATDRLRPRLDRITCFGLDKLLAYTPADARVSLIATSAAVQEMCERCEAEGRRRNTVRRQLYRAASMLLRAELGRAERDRIFADVDYPAEDDTREVLLTPAEIGRLFDACDALAAQESTSPLFSEMPSIIRTALLTSADRGVLLSGNRPGGARAGLLVRDVSIYLEPAPHGEGERYSGELYLDDRKAAARRRTVPIGDRLARELLLLVRGRAEDEAVFRTRYEQLDYLWQAVRREARLPGLRFKDLRAQTAIYAERAGIPQTVVMRTMGHADEAMTRRYQRHQAAMTSEQTAALESAMFAA